MKLKDHPYVEWLNQNGVYNSSDKTFGTWVRGEKLPITLEEVSSITDGDSIYVFGTNSNKNIYQINRVFE